MLAGSPSDEVLLIESGAVDIVLTAPEGVESIIGRYGPGELIGDIGVIMRRPRTAGVVGQQEGNALHVPGAAFRALVERDKDALMLVYELMCRRLLKADRRQLALASRKVRHRIAAQLLDWAEDFGDPQGPTIVVRGVTQQYLARTIGASLKTVEGELGKLREERLLETGWQRFVLLRPELLESLLGRPDWRP
jgi:CRP/FNR family transcriptional regulator, cyclic AMP receptor protein